MCSNHNNSNNAGIVCMARSCPLMHLSKRTLFCGEFGNGVTLSLQYEPIVDTVF